MFIYLDPLKSLPTVATNALDLQSATVNSSPVGNMHRAALHWLRGRWHALIKSGVLGVAVEAT